MLASYARACECAARITYYTLVAAVAGCLYNLLLLDFNQDSFVIYVQCIEGKHVMNGCRSMKM